MHEAPTRLLSERWTRAEARALSHVANQVRAFERGALQFALEELLDDRLQIEAPRIELLRESDVRDRWIEPAVALVFESTQSSARILVDLDESLVNVLLASILETTTRPVASAPLPAMERGILAYAASVLLGRLPATQWTLRAVLVSRDAALRSLRAEPCVFATFAIVGPHLRANVRVLLPASLASLTERVADALDLPPQVAVDCAIVAGYGSLKTSAIAELQARDVVTLDVAYWLPSAEGTFGLVPVHGPSAIARVRPTQSGYEVVPTHPSAHAVRVQGNVRMPASEPTLSLADVAVEFTAEVARIRLTVGEIAKLAEGSIIETGIALPATVVLRAGEKAFAEGVLVDVEGEVGVRITRLR